MQSIVWKSVTTFVATDFQTCIFTIWIATFGNFIKRAMITYLFYLFMCTDVLLIKWLYSKIDYHTLHICDLVLTIKLLLTQKLQYSLSFYLIGLAQFDPMHIRWAHSQYNDKYHTNGKLFGLRMNLLHDDCCWPSYRCKKVMESQIARVSEVNYLRNASRLLKSIKLSSPVCVMFSFFTSRSHTYRIQSNIVV